MLKKKPSHVPEWIWSEFQGFGDDMRALGHPSALATAEKILADPQCEVLWRAMSKRRGAPARRWKPILEKLWHGDPGFGDFHHVMERVCIAAAGIPFHDRFTGAQRKKAGNEIVEAADKLDAALAAIRSETGRFPWEFAAARLEFRDALCNEFRTKFKIEPDSGEFEAASRAIAFVLHKAPYLESIRLGAQAWADGKPLLGHPRSENAERLHFILRVTESMRLNYGQPLRGCVAALTRCLFGCDIDDATVAKIAP